MREFWVFGYGSLMWNPGFDYAEARHARLVGWRRAFCIYSVHHRGSPKRPGLVLGLDRGGVCEGIAYRVSGPNSSQTLAYLRRREQVSGVYREALAPVTLLGAESREVLALAYLVERAHPGYAGHLPLRTQAALIRGATGLSGANLDYLYNTLAHLSDLRIRERDLERLAGLTGPLLRREPRPHRATVRTALRSAKPFSANAPKLRLGERKRFMHRNWLSAPHQD